MNRVGSAVLVVLCLSLTMGDLRAWSVRPGARSRTDRSMRDRCPRRRCRDIPTIRTTATALGVTIDNLPGRGLGLATGVNVYPARLGKHVALGVGAEWLMFSRGRKTLDPTTEGGASGPTVTTRFSVLSPQVSLNFGGRDGWSYVSGGIGWARSPPSSTPRRWPRRMAPRARSTTAAGRAGSRRSTWRSRSTCGSIGSIPRTRRRARPAYGGRRMMVFSVGISVK